VAPDNYLIMSTAFGNLITHFYYCCHYETSITDLLYPVCKYRKFQSQDVSDTTFFYVLKQS